jgi:hypothetical protein
MAPPPIPLPERFAALVEWTPACWLWKGHTSGGYGYIRAFGKYHGWLRAHRVSYMLHVGPIPDGLVLDHLCRNTRCVNPDHLEPVTIGENVLRGFGPTAIAARRSACAKGHPYNAATLRMYGTRRRCRVCDRLVAHEQWLLRDSA